ncbi:MAG: DNA repair protein RecO [Thermogutta sp.]
MSTEKAVALVLRTHDFSESSVVAHLYTREFGKIRVLAKGAKRPKNPFDFALDLLALCRIVFLRKSTEGLDLLTEAKLLRRFRVDRDNLPGLYGAYYVVELIHALTHDYDPNPPLFDLAVETIAELQGKPHPARRVARFEWRLLDLLGHGPSLEQCVGCGESIEQGQRGRLYFGLQDGGVVCPRCRPGRRNVVSLTAETWGAMRALSAPDAETTEDREIPPATRGELRGVLNQLICHLLGQRPRMHEYLAMLPW